MLSRKIRRKIRVRVRYEPRGSLSVFLFFFFQIQDLVVGPGDKISCTYSRVIEKEVDLLTMRKKTSNKKAVL